MSTRIKSVDDFTYQFFYNGKLRKWNLLTGFVVESGDVYDVKGCGYTLEVADNYPGQQRTHRLRETDEVGIVLTDPPTWASSEAVNFWHIQVEKTRGAPWRNYVFIPSNMEHDTLILQNLPMVFMPMDYDRDNIAMFTSTSSYSCIRNMKLSCDSLMLGDKSMTNILREPLLQDYWVDVPSELLTYCGEPLMNHF